MRRMIITSSLLLAMSATAMASQVYKWVDAQGVTHFGAQPPQGQEATSINTATPQPKPVVSEEKKAAPTFESIADPEQAAIDKKVKQEIAAKEAERKKYCTDMRTNLAQLQNNPRVRVEVDGELRRLNEEERQARISETQKSITDNCK
ncbi:DUF4124 domain-containing protein [Pseudomonas sp. MIL19]|uniref:DUF4124 domain-containing protein n=1 Tax=Pseudomonas sp. MIL19 TaxID=2976979 RepID=UPI001DD1B648|nr:DUF4124 domain-containing protein [Pseudomonas sp. MIL19]MBU0807713.1 DUF4124 domain-containing protein [Gammaproteobacteria bacterium]MBU0882104.1 DUF4124 domain-containing protein [Gammaproteobacteria bacterium]MBU1859098.1 DUF4124 domain-containing protein [Gammaproteobacteria bacterium]MDD2158954.1 DUF4124 domain-containing protein [Pseudomonas sp. MIL19]